MPPSLGMEVPTDCSKLPDDSDKLKQMVLFWASNCRALHEYSGKLEQRLFGRKSEKIEVADGQRDFLADALVESAKAQAEPPPVEDDAEHPQPKTSKRARRRLPADLPREEVVHDVPEADRTCPLCSKPYAKIGEERTERLEIIPSVAKVVVDVRMRYACGCSCDCEARQVVEAQLPPQVIEGGMATAGTLAHVVLSKYGDHLPLNRQEAIFARHGLDISRSTMCDWVMKCYDAVVPLVNRMAAAARKSKVLNTDDTGIGVLDKGKTRRAYLWVYVGDNSQPYTVYEFTRSRSRAGPQKFLEDFKGWLQADAYPAYNIVFAQNPDIVEVGCWAHARRKFFEARSCDGLHAPHAMKQIQRLYAIERRIKDCTEDERLAVRQAESLPILEELFAWMEATIMTVQPKSGIAQALSYAISNKQALMRYCENGALSIDNNAAERALRSVVVGRNNWLFAGSDRGGHAAAAFFTLIQSGKRCGVNLFAWLRDIFDRLPSSKQSEIDQFLPDVWKANHQLAEPPSPVIVG